MPKRIPKPIAIISRERRETQTPYQKANNRWTWDYTLYDVANQCVLGTHSIEYADWYNPHDEHYTNESDVAVASLAQAALRKGYMIVARVNGSAAEASMRFVNRQKKFNKEGYQTYDEYVANLPGPTMTEEQGHAAYQELMEGFYGDE